MLNQILKALVGTKNDRDLRRLRPLVTRIHELEQGLAGLPDDSLRAKTSAWRTELAGITDRGALAERLDALLPEAFAVVLTACRRLSERRTQASVLGQLVVWDMVPFDVQLMGGIALHRGKVAEMATGEGKTLVSTLPVYLNALTGLGVHVVTVNEYLAARDSEWMGVLYRFLGLTVGCIQHQQSPDERRLQYQADITYGTNAEFGFDYLRDNGIACRRGDQVQRGHNFAVVDEVDSVLIDEARTPLIISGPSVVHTDNKEYERHKPVIAGLVESQKRLCRRFLREAEDLMAKARAAGDGGEQSRAALERQAGLLLFRVKQGQPQLPELLALLESAEMSRWMKRAELSLHGDQTKELFLREKEALFFAVDEKSRDVDLTEKGRLALEPDHPDGFTVPDLARQLQEIEARTDLDLRRRMELKQQAQQAFEARTQRIHTLSQLLKAYCLYERDVHYVVQENKVLIVDEHTGRVLPGRRWNDGLHQAVEAKEGVEIERETQTYATITIQNYFRLYAKLAGMTGTAETEAQELNDIYRLGLLVVPTHRPCIRKDLGDAVYRTKREKWEAVVREIVEVHNQGRPVLVGTVSVEASERLAALLSKTGVAFSVLNAKHHRQEAEIVSRAGQRGTITIATNMAGRGTDIKLGPGVAELGGLHVIGTERHESRRVDRQLRGRCSRQGDPGSSRFFLSLEDDLMRMYAPDRVVRFLRTIPKTEGRAIEHPFLRRSVEQAQKRVEQHHYQGRRRTLDYDDVMNRQRDVIYGFRNEILGAEEVRGRLQEMVMDVVGDKVREHVPATAEMEPGRAEELLTWVNLTFPVGLKADNLAKTASIDEAANHGDWAEAGLSPRQAVVAEAIVDAVRRAYDIKVRVEQPEALVAMERQILLSAIDRQWREHLYAMDSLRTAIALRSYGQKDPLVEYKAEAHQFFTELTLAIKQETCRRLFLSATSVSAFQEFLRMLPGSSGVSSSPPLDEAATKPSPAGLGVQELPIEVLPGPKPIRAGPKVSRNEPCACGSGRKSKFCCGR